MMMIQLISDFNFRFHVFVDHYLVIWFLLLLLTLGEMVDDEKHICVDLCIHYACQVV